MRRCDDAADRCVLHDQPLPGRHRHAVLGDQATRDGAHAARARPPSTRLGQLAGRRLELGGLGHLLGQGLGQLGRERVSGAVDVRERVQYGRVMLQRDGTLRRAPVPPRLAPTPRRRRRVPSSTARGRGRRRRLGRRRRAGNAEAAAGEAAAAARPAESGRDDDDGRRDELGRSGDAGSSAAARDGRLAAAATRRRRDPVKRGRRPSDGDGAPGESAGAAGQPRAVRDRPVVAGAPSQRVRCRAGAVLVDADAGSESAVVVADGDGRVRRDDGRWQHAAATTLCELTKTAGRRRQTRYERTIHRQAEKKEPIFFRVLLS